MGGLEQTGPSVYNETRRRDRNEKESAVSNQAYIIIKQNEYMKVFRKAGATDAAKARTLAELGIKPSRIFRRMQDKDVFRSGRTPDTFYIDEAAAEEFVESRRRRVYYMMLLAIIVAALIFFLGRR